MLIALCLPGNLAVPDAQSEVPPAGQKGSADNMVSMSDFGYRQIDSAANENARNWLSVNLREWATKLSANRSRLVYQLSKHLSPSTELWMTIGAL